MRIAYCSDLHLEFDDVILKNEGSADVLVLAGDILMAQDLHDHPPPQVPYDAAIIKLLGSRQRKAQQYRDFIARCAFQFPHVVAIAGNHEFYHGRWVGSIQHLRDEYGRFPNVHYLERDTLVLNGVRFIGATIWTDLNRGDPMTLHAVSDMMNDYRVIRHDGLGYVKLRPAHTLSRHRESVDYIKHVLGENKDQPTVVVGHHAPSHLSIHEMYKRDHLMNGAYYSDLSELILDNTQIKAWFHGHTHTPFDYAIGDTRVLCNPRGYYGHDESAESFQLRYVDI